MADQTNAEVSDERLRDIKSWAAKLSTWSRADGHPSPEFYGELASVLNELLNRRSVTSQASEGAEPMAFLLHDDPELGNYLTRSKDAAERSGLPVTPLYASPSKRVERLETALREIDNRATLPGGDDTPYRGQDKNLTDLRWIADRARQALAGRS